MAIAREHQRGLRRGTGRLAGIRHHPRSRTHSQEPGIRNWELRSQLLARVKHPEAGAMTPRINRSQTRLLSPLGHRQDFGWKQPRPARGGSVSAAETPFQKFPVRFHRRRSERTKYRSPTPDGTLFVNQTIKHPVCLSFQRNTAKDEKNREGFLGQGRSSWCR